MKKIIRWLVIGLIFSLGLLVVPAWGSLPPRVIMEYTGAGYQNYMGALSITREGTLLVTQNGFHEPKIMELDNQGEILWEYGPIQANSAVMLSNGNVLIADSGAPGYPLKPRLIEVNREGEILWSFNFTSRAFSPRMAQELPGGRILVVYANRVMEIDRKGQIHWLYAGLYYPVWAERLSSGKTLVVDRGFYGGKVLIVDGQGQVQWEYGTYGSPGQPGPLRGPNWATSTADGEIIIADQAAGRLLKVRGDKAETIHQWQEVLGYLPVAGRWTALPDLDQEEIYLSLTLSGGRSVIWQVQKEIKTFLAGEKLGLQKPPLILDGVLYGNAREFLNLVGGQVSWDSNSGGLRITQGGKQFLVVASENKAFHLGGNVLEAPLRLHGGTALLPLEFMKTYFGLDYHWDEQKGELHLRSPKEGLSKGEL